MRLEYERSNHFDFCTHFIYCDGHLGSLHDTCWLVIALTCLSCFSGFPRMIFEGFYFILFLFLPSFILFPFFGVFNCFLWVLLSALAPRKFSLLSLCILVFLKDPLFLSFLHVCFIFLPWEIEHIQKLDLVLGGTSHTGPFFFSFIA